MAETPARPFRAPRKLWQAYDMVCADEKTTASADVIDHVIRKIRRKGSPEAKALLAEALEELNRPRPGPKRR